MDPIFAKVPWFNKLTGNLDGIRHQAVSAAVGGGDNRGAADGLCRHHVVGRGQDVRVEGVRQVAAGRGHQAEDAAAAGGPGAAAAGVERAGAGGRVKHLRGMREKVTYFYEKRFLFI